MAVHWPFLHLVVTSLVLPPSQPQKSTGPQFMTRCCCSTTSSLGLWKQSSKALDFSMTSCEKPHVNFFVSCSPTRALLNGLCQAIAWQEAITEHPKPVNMKAVCDEEKLFLKEWVYLFRAQGLTKWQGQAPYNCPLQYFSHTTLKHLYCSILVTTFEGELSLFYPYICFSNCDESMFNFPVSVRKKTRDYLCLKSVFMPELHCIIAHSKLFVPFLP